MYLRNRMDNDAEELHTPGNQDTLQLKQQNKTDFPRML